MSDHCTPDYCAMSVVPMIDRTHTPGTCPETLLCHCGDPVAYGYDGNPNHHRGMCGHCDAVRCDAHPGSCQPTD